MVVAASAAPAAQQANLAIATDCVRSGGRSARLDELKRIVREEALDVPLHTGGPAGRTKAQIAADIVAAMLFGQGSSAPSRVSAPRPSPDRAAAAAAASTRREAAILKMEMADLEAHMAALSARLGDVTTRLDPEARCQSAAA